MRGPEGASAQQCAGATRPRKVAPGRVISTAGREARHTRKSKSKRRDGFRGHVAAEPGTGLITDCEMTMAAGEGSADAENGVKMAARDRFRPGPPAAGDGGPAGPVPGAERESAPAGGTDDAQPQAGAGAEARQGPDARLKVYGDSAYGSGQARADYRDAGHDTVIKPGPLRPAVPGGFTCEDFTVDEEQGTVTCPNGVTRQMSPARTVTFGAACAACPLRSLCTTAKDGRPVTIHPHDGLLRAARTQARTEEFKRAYPTRASIERTIAWTATPVLQNDRIWVCNTGRATDLLAAPNGGSSAQVGQELVTECDGCHWFNGALDGHGAE